MKLVDKVKVYLDKIKKEDKKINSFLYVRPESELLKEAKDLDGKKKKGKLYGQIIGVKSNINVFGLPCSCASKTLEDYYSTYDATVIERIKAEDGIIIGMLNMDEFASGWTGETSAFGPTRNPRVKDGVAGGSSSGSAAAVAAGFCDVSLGSDTGGSIRVPASFCGVVGVKPSYGAVSRHGLIDLSMSLDQIGTLAKNVVDAEKVFEVIKGKDERDTKTFDKIKESKNIGMYAYFSEDGMDLKVKELIDSVISGLKNNNWKFKAVNFKYIDLAIQTYHPLVWTEFYSATRRFDGRKYGKKIEGSAGKEVLRRIYGGMEVTKAELAGRYYHKALQVKELIKEEFEKILENYDSIIMPTTPITAPKIGEKLDFEDLALIDKFTIPANLAEVCAVSIPVGEVDGKPVGLQVICGKGQEKKMFKIAKDLENQIKKA